MTYEFYKVIHMLGLMSLFFGFGGVLIVAYAGVPLQGKAKSMAYMTHGIGLLLLILGGFGMAAKLGLMAHLPGWVHLKIGIWVILGGSIALAKRKGSLGWPIALLLLALGVVAAWAAIYKPF